MIVASFRRHLRKPPRLVYWTLGAAIAFAGAIVARLLAEQVPGYRVQIWLVGAVVIFFGLGVLSLGTKARLHLQNEDGQEAGKPQDGAGEGNRTLA